MEHDKFNQMVGKSLLGTLLGIIAGLFFGILIYLLQYPLAVFNSLITGSIINWEGIFHVPVNFWPEPIIPEMLGICFGAITGASLGGLAALKNHKNNSKTHKDATKKK